MFDIENAVGRQVCFKYSKKNVIFLQQDFFLTIKSGGRGFIPSLQFLICTIYKKNFLNKHMFCFSAYKIVLYYYLTNL